MQTYPQYYPQMNNYGQQYNPQQPYMDRLAGLQQYQQTLQQPQMAGIQMSLPNQPIGLNGKVVDTIEQITANDVPMDGSVAIFPKKDMSEIYLKSWTPNGTIATVVYHPVIGYSSFKLDYVVKWLNDYFEFYGEAKVSCDDNGWIPVQGRLPEDNHKGIYDMQLVTLEDGEVCMGVYNNREKEWWTRKQEGERWYTNKHNVIAWQPLPEPYKEEKKC